MSCKLQVFNGRMFVDSASMFIEIARQKFVDMSSIMKDESINDTNN